MSAESSARGAFFVVRSLARCFGRLFSQVLAELGSPPDHMLGTCAMEVADLI